MATKLYLRSVSGGELTVMTEGEYIKDGLGFWNGDTVNYGDAGGGQLSTTAGTAGAGTTHADQNSVNGPTTPIRGGAYVSRPVSAAFTLSGTVTFHIWGSESGNANAGLVVRLYKLNRTDGSFTQIVAETADSGGELGTSSTERIFTATPTSTNVEVGDRLFFFVGFDDAGGNMVTGFTLSTFYNSADGSNGGSYVQLTENATFFDDTAPSGDTLYLRSDAITGITGGADTRALLESAGSGSSDTAVLNTVGGPTSGIEFTKTAGGTIVQWYTNRLTAFTLSNPIQVRLRLVGSDNLSKACVYAEIAVVNADGSSPTIYGWAGIPGEGPIPGAISDVTQTFDGRIVGPNIAVTEGQRIRFRLFLDENYWANNFTMVTGKTATLTFNDPADSAAQSWIKLSGTVTESSYVDVKKQYKRLVGPQHLGGSPQTLYTAPLAGPALIRHIHIINPTGATRAVTLSIGSDAGGTRIFDARQIAPGGIIDERKAAEHWINAGEVIQGNADLANACCVVIDGIEYR